MLPPRQTDVNSLFMELKERAVQEGIVTFDEYASLIDEILEEKNGLGDLGDDEDYEQLRSDLGMMWDDLSEALNKM